MTRLQRDCIATVAAANQTSAALMPVLHKLHADSMFTFLKPGSLSIRFCIYKDIYQLSIEKVALKRHRRTSKDAVP